MKRTNEALWDLAHMTRAAYQKDEDPDPSHDAVDQLLGFLDADPEIARRKYESIRTRLTNLFRLKGCPSPAEYAARTIEGAARELVDGESSQIKNPYLYFHRVAINVSNALKGSWSQTQSYVDGRSSDSEAAIDFHSALDAQLREQRLLQCLRECLNALAPESLDLITKYHQPGNVDIKNARKELARSLGITPAALRMRAFNIRASLVRSVANCIRRSESSSRGDSGHFGAR
jgi:hypothetical protein